jgi:hypothetical protein
MLLAGLLAHVTQAAAALSAPVENEVIGREVAVESRMA